MITSAGTTPGGWFQTINSYGSVVQMQHESQVYSANDTITSFHPISEVLTGVTGDRRDDVLAGADVVISDAGPLIYPSFGSIVASTEGVPVTSYVQSGDEVVFDIEPTPSTGTQIYAYVWRLWDDTVRATTDPTTLPVAINVGGQPYTGELHYSVMPVQIDGQNVVLDGTITANNPPIILPSPTVSLNDAYFPYSTQIVITAIDFDNDDLTFAWYNGFTSLGAGMSTFVGSLAGTWTGNGVTVIDNFAGTQNVFSTAVGQTEMLTCVITDARGGVTSLDLQLRGFDAPAPSAGGAGAITGLTADASTLPIQRIGAGQTVVFTAYGQDLSGGAVTFLWNFAGSNGWTIGPVYTTGTTTVLPNGVYQNTYTKDISGEVVLKGTVKTSVAEVLISSATMQTPVQFAVDLIANQPPNTITFTTKANNAVIGAGETFPAGTPIEYDAVVQDSQGDICEYQWVFQQPEGVIPSTVTLWGAKIAVDTTAYPDGFFIIGALTVTDRMGAQYSTAAPFVQISGTI